MDLHSKLLRNKTKTKNACLSAFTKFVTTIICDCKVYLGLILQLTTKREPKID